MGALLLVCATGCDPEPERTYLALGAAPETRKFTLGTYRSSNPAVLAITDLHDTSGSGCSGVAVLGCPGSEITVRSTSITFQPVGVGDASIRGRTEKGDEVSEDFRVEQVADLLVQRVVVPNDNESPLVDVGVQETVVVELDATAALQVSLLGPSEVALGYVEVFDVVSADESVVSVSSGKYSRGYRARLKAVGAGDTTVTISAADVTRELSIGVE